jgi:hypothetical protein
MLIAPEAVRKHDRRTVLESGESHVVPRLQAHVPILPPPYFGTVGNVRWIVDVTSDARLAERVRQARATVYPAAKFRDLIDPLNAT